MKFVFFYPASQSRFVWAVLSWFPAVSVASVRSVGGGFFCLSVDSPSFVAVAPFAARLSLFVS
jgi:hypothetical protein